MVRIPKGAYCTDEFESSFTDTDGTKCRSYCGTYYFPNGKLAGWLMQDFEDNEVVYEIFDRP